MLSCYLYFSVLLALIMSCIICLQHLDLNYFLKLTVFFPNARVEIQWGPFFLSLGANSASKLSTWNVWTTRQISSTCAFDKLKYIKAPFVFAWVPGMNSGSLSTQWILFGFVGVVRSHQIPMILLGPSRWTVIPRGHHQHWATWVDIAEGTRCIVVLEIFVKRVKRQFVLSAIYQSSVLNAVLVLIVLWGLRFDAPPLWV